MEWLRPTGGGREPSGSCTWQHVWQLLEDHTHPSGQSFCVHRGVTHASFVAEGLNNPQQHAVPLAVREGRKDRGYGWCSELCMTESAHCHPYPLPLHPPNVQGCICC